RWAVPLPVRPDRGARSAARAAVVAGPVLALVLVTVVGVWLLGGPAGTPTPGTPTPVPAASGRSSAAPELCSAAQPGAEDVVQAVCALARGRAEAFRTASTTALAEVDEPGSAAMAADAALVSRLSGQQLRLDGVGFAVTDVRVLARTGDTVTVTASVATSAHRQIRSDGSVATQVPAAPPRGVRLVLVASAGGSGSGGGDGTGAGGPGATGPAAGRSVAVGSSAGRGWLVRSAEPV
ncbi:MAG TPA: hypothetical protein VFP72_25225, partial [Kineosporiaceae bacterium]|nr:hypothetical protein [Kineosporiaceae bacterium]